MKLWTELVQDKAQSLAVVNSYEPSSSLKGGEATIASQALYSMKWKEKFSVFN